MPGIHINRSIDLSGLPKLNNGNYDWKNSVGLSVPFEYDDIKGVVKFIAYDNGKMQIEYNDKKIWTIARELYKVKFGEITGKRTKHYRFEIGELVTNSRGLTGTIVKQYRKGKQNVKFYDIECPKCGYVFDLPESEIFRGRGWCPICDNQNHLEVLLGVNDMWTTNPEIASQLKDPDDGYKYPYGTTKHLQFKCSVCGDDFYKLLMPRRINECYHGIVTCRSCCSGVSYPNRFIYQLLKELNVDFIPEKKFLWGKRRFYDFYLPNDKIIIEAHGEQHYRECGFGISLDEQIRIDKMKYENAINNGFEKQDYIVIDCRESDPEFIMNNILNSRLSELFDLSNIDINKIDKKVSVPIMTNIIQMVNDGMSIKQIANDTKYCETTIRNYIKKAENLELCSYDWNGFCKKSREEQAYDQRQSRAKPFMCIELGVVFMTLPDMENNSERIFGRKFHLTMLWQSLKKGKTYNGYHWKYITRSEFNRIKRESPEKAFGDFFINEEEVA